MAVILIADDEPWYARPLMNAIEARGHEVHLKTNSSDALLFLAEHAVDLIVIDLLMGSQSVDDLVRQLAEVTDFELEEDERVGGLHLCKKVQVQFPQLRVVVLSVLTAPERDEIFSEIGLDCAAVTQLSKESSLESLVGAINGALEEG